MSNEVDHVPNTEYSEDGDTQEVSIVLKAVYEGEEATDDQIKDIRDTTKAINEQTEAINKNNKAKDQAESYKGPGKSSVGMSNAAGKALKGFEVTAQLNSKVLGKSVASIGKFTSTIDTATTSVGAFSFSVNDATLALKRFEDQLNNFTGKGVKVDKTPTNEVTNNEITKNVVREMTLTSKKNVPGQRTRKEHDLSDQPAILSLDRSGMKVQAGKRMDPSKVSDYAYYMPMIDEKQFRQFKSYAGKRDKMISNLDKEFAGMDDKSKIVSQAEGKKLFEMGMGMFTPATGQFKYKPVDAGQHLYREFQKMFPEVQVLRRDAYLSDIVKSVNKQEEGIVGVRPNNLAAITENLRKKNEANLQAAERARKDSEELAQRQLALENAKYDEERATDKANYKAQQARFAGLKGKKIDRRGSFVSRQIVPEKGTNLSSSLYRFDYQTGNKTWTPEEIERMNQQRKVYSPQVYRRAGVTDEFILRELAKYEGMDLDSPEATEAFANSMFEIISTYKVRGEAQSRSGRLDRGTLYGFLNTLYTDTVGLPHDWVDQRLRQMTTSGTNILNRESANKRGNVSYLTGKGTTTFQKRSHLLSDFLKELKVSDVSEYEARLEQLLPGKYQIGSIRAPIDKRNTMSPLRTLSKDEAYGLLEKLFKTEVVTDSSGKTSYFGGMHTDIAGNALRDSRIYDMINYLNLNRNELQKRLGSSHDYFATKLFEDAGMMKASEIAVKQMEADEARGIKWPKGVAKPRKFALHGLNYGYKFEPKHLTVPDPNKPGETMKIPNPAYGSPKFTVEDMLANYARHTAVPEPVDTTKRLEEDFQQDHVKIPGMIASQGYYMNFAKANDYRKLLSYDYRTREKSAKEMSKMIQEALISKPTLTDQIIARDNVKASKQLFLPEPTKRLLLGTPESFSFDPSKQLFLPEPPKQLFLPRTSNSMYWYEPRSMSTQFKMPDGKTLNVKKQEYWFEDLVNDVRDEMEFANSFGNFKSTFGRDYEDIMRYGNTDYTAERKYFIDSVGYTPQEMERIAIEDIGETHNQLLNDMFGDTGRVLAKEIEMRDQYRSTTIQGEYGKQIEKLNQRFLKGKMSVNEYTKSLYQMGMTTTQVEHTLSKMERQVNETAKAINKADKEVDKLNASVNVATPGLNAYARAFDNVDKSATKATSAIDRFDKGLKTFHKRTGGKEGGLFSMSSSVLSGLAIGSLAASFQSGRKIDELVTELTFQASDGGAVISWSGAMNDNWGNMDANYQIRYQNMAESMKSLAYLTTTSFTGMLEAAVEIVKAGLAGPAASAVLISSALMADMENMKIIDVVNGMLGAGRAMGLATTVNTENDITTDDTWQQVIQGWTDLYGDVLLAADMTGSSVQEVIDGLRYVAPLVSAIGMSQDEAIALASVLGNAGLAGQKGARTMASGMLRLASPTEKAAAVMKDIGVDIYDEEGNLKPMIDIINEFQEAFSTMTNEEIAAAAKVIFGADSLKGFSALGAQADQYEEVLKALESDNTGKYMLERYGAEFWGVAVEDLPEKSKELFDIWTNPENVDSMEAMRGAAQGFADEIERLTGYQMDFAWDTSETIAKNIIDLRTVVGEAQAAFIANGGTIEEWEKLVSQSFGAIEEDLEDLKMETQEFFLGGLAETNPFKVIGIGLMSVFEALLRIGETVSSNLAHLVAEILPEISAWLDDTNEKLAAMEIDATVGSILGDAATLSVLGGILGSIHKIIFAMRWPLWIAMQLNEETRDYETLLEGIIDLWDELMNAYIAFVKIKMVADVIGGVMAVAEVIAETIDFFISMLESVTGLFTGKDERGSLGRLSKKGKASAKPKNPYEQVLNSIEDNGDKQIQTTREVGDKMVKAIEALNKDLNKGVDEVDDSIEKNTVATTRTTDAVEDINKTDGVEFDVGKSSKTKTSTPGPDPDISDIATMGAAVGRRGTAGSPGRMGGNPITAFKGAMSASPGGLSTKVLAGIAAIPGPWIALISGITASLRLLHDSTIRNINSTQEWMRAYVEPYHKFLYAMLPEETQKAMSTVLTGASEIEGGLNNLTPLSVFLYAGFDAETQKAIYETMIAGDEIQAVYDSLPIYAQRIWDDMSLLTQAAIVELGGVEPVLDEIAAEFPKLGKLIQEQMTDEFKGAKTEVGKVLEELYKVSAELDKDHKKDVTVNYETTGTPPTYVDSDNDGSNDLTEKYSLPTPPQPEPLPPMPEIQSSFGLSAYNSRGLGHNITNNNNNDNRIFNISYNVERGQEDTAFNKMVSDLRRI